MTDLGTFQITFPDFAISYPEPQFRADARELREELRAKFLAGMAAVYDKHAEIARQKYNAMDPATDRPPIAREPIIVGRADAGRRIKQLLDETYDREGKRTLKKKVAKPATKRKRK